MTHISLPAEFKLTSPKKVLYPGEGITKQDIAQYYEAVSAWILPFLVKRLLTLVRCPASYKQCFYQKHFTHKMPPAFQTMTIKEKNKTDEYFYITDFEGLMRLVQMNTLELHPWGSSVPDVNYPDMIIFDLDPAPDISWRQVVSAANLIRKYLSKYKLKCFVKTTGGKGLHIVIPIKPEYTWNVVKKFAHTFVQFLELNHPSDFIGEMAKVKRKGKIFVDYLRNQKGATAICAYSTRARPHAPVSTPIHWDELTARIEDTFFTIVTIPGRLQALRKNPWQGFFETHQSLQLNNL